MNLTTNEEIVLLKVRNPFTISWLAEKIGKSNNETYHILKKLERNGFITHSPYRLTRKGATYIRTFIEVAGQIGNPRDIRPIQDPLDSYPEKQHAKVSICNRSL